MPFEPKRFAAALGLGALSLFVAVAASAQSTNHPYDTIRLGPGDWADAAGTAAALSRDGVSEMNPVLAPFGDAASVAALPLKYGMKHGVVAAGATPAQANVGVESVSWFGGCANLATALGGAPPLALGTGLVCGVIANKKMTAKYERETGRHLNGTEIAADGSEAPFIGTAAQHAARRAATEQAHPITRTAGQPATQSTVASVPAKAEPFMGTAAQHAARRAAAEQAARDQGMVSASNQNVAAPTLVSAEPFMGTAAQHAARRAAAEQARAQHRH